MSQPLEGLLVGKLLVDRYAIDEVIGRGGMSVVYRATDQRLGRPVALKVVLLPTGNSDRHHLRERLRREAGSAAQIPAHPNVVHVYDYGTDPALDLDFIAMELLRGRDLKALLSERRPSRDEALRILREAARGVAAGHRVGIVHRDVKPANIFLTGEDRVEVVKILDFGIAKALEVQPEDDLTLTGQMPHSPAYASPEQLRGSTSLTPASDVYQLGLVGYQLLTGERAFSEEERARLAAGEVMELPRRGDWDALPAGLQAVLARATQVRPDERFPDAVAFVEALVAGAGGEAEEAPEDDATLLAVEDEAATWTSMPPPAEPERPATAAPAAGPPRSAARPTPRPRAWRAVMVGGGAMLALLGLWAITRGERPTSPAPSEEAGMLETGELDREFRPLLQSASQRLLEERTSELADQAAAVQRVIVDLHQSWVRGEMDRHLSHYADRVDFYGSDNAPRSEIERARQESLESYVEREINLERQAVTFPEPDRALALVDKSWSFAGPGGQWSGSARGELILRLNEGRWQVVSERDVEVHRSDREPR